MLLGFAIAALLVPAVAVATTSLVTIANSTGTHKAAVTAANQLQVSRAGPGSAVVAFGGPRCSSGGIYQIPAGKALIITGADFYDRQAATGFNELDLFVGPSASPCTNFVAGSIQTDADVSQNQVFDPGIPVPAGDALGMEGINESGTAHIYGYLVPAAAVPASLLNTLPRAPQGRSASLGTGG